MKLSPQGADKKPVSCIKLLKFSKTSSNSTGDLIGILRFKFLSIHALNELKSVFRFTI